ncbi:MAG TPA: hypothetical protein VF064_01870 [Pyrinomonadaceae bacterium]
MAKKGGHDESRAAEGEPSKQELQQQMEATRDSISETVAEIREVVSQQYDEVKETYESVKEGVDEALDWREKFSENPVVWGAGAVSVGILIGIGLAQTFEDEDARGSRRKSKAAGAAGYLVGELSGFADAVLPTISGKVKELFGLDLAAYLGEARERARLKGATERGARKKSAAKRSSKGATKKRAASKKGGAAKRGASKKRA